MESPSHHNDIPIWWNGTQRWMTGLTKRTTCDDVIYALLYSSGLHETDSTDNYAIFEKWREVERPLSARTKLLKVWTFWGEEQGNVKLSMRSLDDYFLPGESSLYMRSKRRHRRSSQHKSRHASHDRCLAKRGCVECSRLRSLEQLVKLVVSQERKIQELSDRIHRTDRQVDSHEAKVRLKEAKIHQNRVEQNGLDYVQNSYLNSHSSSSNSSIDSSTFTTIDLKKVKAIFPESSWQELEEIMRVCEDLGHVEQRLGGEIAAVRELTPKVKQAMGQMGLAAEGQDAEDDERTTSELEEIKVQMVRTLTNHITNEYREKELDRKSVLIQNQLEAKMEILRDLQNELTQIDRQMNESTASGGEPFLTKDTAPYSQYHTDNPDFDSQDRTLHNEHTTPHHNTEIVREGEFCAPSRGNLNNSNTKLGYGRNASYNDLSTLASEADHVQRFYDDESINRNPSNKRETTHDRLRGGNSMVFSARFTSDYGSFRSKDVLPSDSVSVGQSLLTVISPDDTPATTITSRNLPRRGREVRRASAIRSRSEERGRSSGSSPLVKSREFLRHRSGAAATIASGAIAGGWDVSGGGGVATDKLKRALGWDEENGFRYSPAILNQYGLDPVRSNASHLIFDHANRDAMQNKGAEILDQATKSVSGTHLRFEDGDEEEEEEEKGTGGGTGLLGSPSFLHHSSGQGEEYKAQARNALTNNDSRGRGQSQERNRMHFVRMQGGNPRASVNNEPAQSIDSSNRQRQSGVGDTRRAETMRSNTKGGESVFGESVRDGPPSSRGQAKRVGPGMPGDRRDSPGGDTEGMTPDDLAAQTRANTFVAGAGLGTGNNRRRHGEAVNAGGGGGDGSITDGVDRDVINNSHDPRQRYATVNHHKVPSLSTNAIFGHGLTNELSTTATTTEDRCLLAKRQTESDYLASCNESDANKKPPNLIATDDSERSHTKEKMRTARIAEGRCKGHSGRVIDSDIPDAHVRGQINSHCGNDSRPNTHATTHGHNNDGRIGVSPPWKDEKSNHVIADASHVNTTPVNQPYCQYSNTNSDNECGVPNSGRTGPSFDSLHSSSITSNSNNSNNINSSSGDSSTSDKSNARIPHLRQPNFKHSDNTSTGEQPVGDSSADSHGNPQQPSKSSRGALYHIITHKLNKTNARKQHRSQSSSVTSQSQHSCISSSLSMDNIHHHHHHHHPHHDTPTTTTTATVEPKPRSHLGYHNHPHNSQQQQQQHHHHTSSSSSCSSSSTATINAASSSSTETLTQSPHHWRGGNKDVIPTNRTRPHGMSQQQGLHNDHDADHERRANSCDSERFAPSSDRTIEQTDNPNRSYDGNDIHNGLVSDEGTGIPRSNSASTTQLHQLGSSKEKRCNNDSFTGSRNSHRFPSDDDEGYPGNARFTQNDGASSSPGRNGEQKRSTSTYYYSNSGRDDVNQNKNNNQSYSLNSNSNGYAPNPDPSNHRHDTANPQNTFGNTSTFPFTSSTNPLRSTDTANSSTPGTAITNTNTPRNTSSPASVSAHREHSAPPLYSNSTTPKLRPTKTSDMPNGVEPDRSPPAVPPASGNRRRRVNPHFCDIDQSDKSKTKTTTDSSSSPSSFTPNPKVVSTPRPILTYDGKEGDLRINGFQKPTGMVMVSNGEEFGNRIVNFSSLHDNNNRHHPNNHHHHKGWNTNSTSGKFGAPLSANQQPSQRSSAVDVKYITNQRDVNINKGGGGFIGKECVSVNMANGQTVIRNKLDDVNDSNSDTGLSSMHSDETANLETLV